MLSDTENTAHTSSGFGVQFGGNREQQNDKHIDHIFS